ncbi:hypothetical protein [Paraburkholderia youngii]|uniref:hypothetical protein n=1 Tax=Paraburkholderia youngii TaxID=2782701 RepID=UPI003D205ACF
MSKFGWLSDEAARPVGQSQRLLKFGDELRGRNTQSLTPVTEFDNVQSAFPALAFADEGLGCLKASCDFFLCKASLFSGRSKQLNKQSVPAGVDRFFHWRLNATSRKVASCFGIVQNRLFASDVG